MYCVGIFFESTDLAHQLNFLVHILDDRLLLKNRFLDNFWPFNNLLGQVRLFTVHMYQNIDIQMHPAQFIVFLIEPFPRCSP